MSTPASGSSKARLPSKLEDQEKLLALLHERSEASPNLLSGFAPMEQHWNTRDSLIPYFHVLGRSANHPTLRTLLIGGWGGNEMASTYALMRLIEALERKFQLVEGMEATIYPFLNIEARRTGALLTETQMTGENRPWHGSTLPHIRVIEGEVTRHPYDAVLHAREIQLATHFSIEAWTPTPAQGRVLSDILQRFAASDPDLQWKVNASSTRFSRKLTPVPNQTRQPMEIVLAVPGTFTDDQLASESTGLLLTLLHGMRQARAEGLL